MKKLKCALPLPLQEMALRRVVVHLFSGPDVLASITNYQLDGDDYESIAEWQETCDSRIKDKIAKLRLPESIAKQMIDVVEPISLEIRRWKFIHEGSFSSTKTVSLPGSANLCWTTAGAIDYRRTAEELILCNMLHVLQRYKIACFFCLEDYIPHLWEELTDGLKGYFYNHKPTKGSLLYFWPHILKGDISELDYLWRTSNKTFNQYAFELSAANCLKSAAEYFFKKLTDEQRRASLAITVRAVLLKSMGVLREDCPNEKPSSVLRYLLSVMTPEQQMEAIELMQAVDTHHLFLCFLEWPQQHLFRENADLLWTFFPPSSYFDLQRRVLARLRRPGCCFPKLFHEFFMHSPLGFKRYFVNPNSETNVISAYDFLCLFFDSEDSESIQVIFRNVNAAQRVRLVFHPYVLKLFYRNILEDRFRMVKVCVLEATLSAEDRERLKKAFMALLERDFTRPTELENQNLKRFFEFLNEVGASADEEKKARNLKLENYWPE